MTTKYFALLTSQGAAKLANAAALGTKVQITQMGVGDGGGTLPTPTGTQTTLVGEKRRALLNALSVDAANSSQIIAEQIIPENEGGFWIREIGLYDSDNTLIAVANCPETYKPLLAEGSGRTQTVRMILIINSTDAVTLKIDPAVVLATRQYVDDKVIEVKAYTDESMAKHLAEINPHDQYALAEAVATALAGKLAKDQNGADINDKVKFNASLGLSDIVLAGVGGGGLTAIGHIKLPVIVGGVKRTVVIQWGDISNISSSTTPATYEVEAVLPVTLSMVFRNLVTFYDDSAKPGVVPSVELRTGSATSSRIACRAINAIVSTRINYLSVGLL
ncbi:phage tail protein [Rahnella sp. AA]|uniref:phage tail protein n=1 Tax=Rahnella sp. AA TaxID=2057180 RepID=UPI001E555DDB|nr:phage tail protein [Rahnella sp. AA]